MGRKDGEGIEKRPGGFFVGRRSQKPSKYAALLMKMPCIAFL